MAFLASLILQTYECRNNECIDTLNSINNGLLIPRDTSNSERRHADLPDEYHRNAHLFAKLSQLKQERNTVILTTITNVVLKFRKLPIMRAMARDLVPLERMLNLSK